MTTTVRLVDVYQDTGAEAILYSLLEERAAEDDPFLSWEKRKVADRATFGNYFNSYPYYKWYLAKKKDIAVGVVTVSHKNEIGIVLFSKYRSKGYGKEILQLVLSEVDPLNYGEFKAQIHKHNFRSIRLFESFGFCHTENVYERTRR